MKRLLPVLLLCCVSAASAQAPNPPLLTWVKRHPLPDKKGKPSPKLGYEAAYAYDPVSRLLIRYGGHNQGGGGEQHSETWTYDLDKDVWTFMNPNTLPPGVCCDQQNVYHDALGKYVRFPSFSASHGWQSIREVRLRDSSVWTYDLPTNRWLDMRPIPEPAVRPLRGAAYDPAAEVIVLHGGETAGHGTQVYDLYTNTWHDLKPKPAPAESLSQPGFAFDEVHRKFVLFGSQFATDPRTWLYDLKQNDWQTLDVDQRPPFDKSCPVLAADTRNGIVLASIPVDKKVETWALDTEKKTWTKLPVKWTPEDNEPTNAGTRNRLLLYLPDRNLFVQEIRNKSEQQIWTFRYAEAPPLPPLPPRPSAVHVRADGKSATLTWSAGKPGGVSPRRTFNVYRGVGARSWDVDWKLVAKETTATEHIDRDLPAGSVFYRIHAVDKGKEGPAGPLARTQPPLVRDLVVSALGPKEIDLTWQAPAKDIVGYHVERAEVMVYSSDEVKGIKDRYEPTSDLAVGQIRKIGPFQRLTKKAIEATRFTDTTIDLTTGPVKEIKTPLWNRDPRSDQVNKDGKPYRYAVYAYRVIAVNALGFESGPSPARFSFPSNVENVFAKEDGKSATSLKWGANPEKGIQGYIVYRHNGRFSKEKIVLLTEKPLTERTFRDGGAGTAARRYEIVAVDALGQEGMPSYPVWSRRDWASFYVPYQGEWHP